MNARHPPCHIFFQFSNTSRYLFYISANRLSYVAASANIIVPPQRGSVQMRTNKDNTGKAVRAAAAAVAIAFMLVAAAPMFFGGNDNGDTILGADAGIDITGKTVSEIGTEIHDAIAAADAGDTVTVTGSKTDANSSLEITIPAGMTVIWKAGYIGNSCILLYGDGVFEVADGAEVKIWDGDSISARYDNVHVAVTGGLVECTMAGGDAVHIGTGGITVTGGTIKASVRSYGGAIFGYPGSGAIVIKGGTVEADGSDGIAIYQEGGTVTVTGGTVTANGTAIWIDSGVAAYLDGTVIGPLHAGNSAVIVEVGSLDIPEESLGTSDGTEIVKGSYGGSIAWTLYENGDLYLVFGGDAHSLLWKEFEAPVDDPPGDDPPEDDPPEDDPPADDPPEDDPEDDNGDDTGDVTEEEAAKGRNWTAIVFALVIVLFLLLVTGAGLFGQRK